ncbi:MAG: dihydrofolate reductase family protein [Deltaproteobacteria bacterium]
MRRLTMFENVTLDGFFTDANGDMSWAHEQNQDDESKAFTSENASGGGALVFGRITYQQMEAFWPTPAAAQAMPAVARAMNEMPKLVFSKSLDRVTWKNTTLLKGDPATEMRKLKKEPGPDMVIMGSGIIVSQLAAQGLIDEYKLLVVPVVLGKGRTPFGGVEKNLKLKLTSTRSFKNGNIYACYEPA